MTRANILYNQVIETSGIPGTGWADEMRTGFYKIKRGDIWRPVAIWHGQPLEPWTGDLMDRAPRWNVFYCGRPIMDESLVWPVCAKHPIVGAEYRYLLARMRHAQDHDRRDPFGAKNGRVDWLNSTPAF